MKRALLLAVLLIGQFMCVIDVLIVNVAMPSIGTHLHASRFVQGAGAAVLVPQVFSIIQLTFHGQARARALSFYVAVLSGGAVAGLVIGGAIVTANLFGATCAPSSPSWPSSSYASNAGWRPAAKSRC